MPAKTEKNGAPKSRVAVSATPKVKGAGKAEDLYAESRDILPQGGKPSRPREAIRLAIKDKNFKYSEWLKKRRVREVGAKN